MSDRKWFSQRYFERLYGRKPNAADRARLLSLKNDLGLSDTDELWPLLMTLDFYAEPVERLGTVVPKLLDEFREYRSAENKKTDRVGNLSVTDLRRLLEEAQFGLVSEMRAKKKRSRLLQVTASMIFGVFIGAFAAYLYVVHNVGLCAEPPHLLKNGASACFVSVADG